MAKSGPRSKPAVNDHARDRLIEAAIRVLARDGFAHTSGRTVAAEAGTVNGSIFYYFGSMEGLLTATLQVLAERGLSRLHAGLGGDDAAQQWPNRIADVLRAEVDGDDGRAVLELMMGASTSATLASDVRIAIDRAIEYVADQLTELVDGTALGQLVSAQQLAEFVGATFLGLEILGRLGREVDVEHIASLSALAVRFMPAGPVGQEE